MKSFSEVSNGKRIVAMVEWSGMQIIATEDNLYAVMKDGTIEMMKFKVVDEQSERS